MDLLVLEIEDCFDKIGEKTDECFHLLFPICNIIAESTHGENNRAILGPHNSGSCNPDPGQATELVQRR